MSVIAAELAHQQQRTNYALRQGAFVAEVPIRIHERELDSGGDLEWHVGFVRYLTSAGVCFCRVLDEEWIERHGPDFHVCDRRRRPDRFRAPNYRMHPHRLKRALRQLRGLSKPAFEVVYPVIARGMTWEQCRARIALDRFARGEEPYTDHEWVCLVISGLDLLSSSF